MDRDFRHYCKERMPRLDEAFREELSLIIGDAAMKNHGALEVLMEGGKMIRGCLLCLVTETLGGGLISALPRAVAVELIHGATLIHDDFVDQDRVRRNRPAIWTLEGGRRAVLLGDIIFATTIKRMNDLSREDGIVVSRAIAQVSKGAFQEPLDPLELAKGIRTGMVHERLYEKIIRLKTGILFGAACEWGAMAARVNEGWVHKWSRYGLLIGEAYQIADDMKEVRDHLSSRSIRAEQMALLAPAFLYFAKGAEPYVLSVLESDGTGLEPPLWGFFESMATRMEEAIEARLHRAVSEVDRLLPHSEHRALIMRAPWDLIQMFQES
jgi:geranylgeranyl pyrophosphate synthase